MCINHSILNSLALSSFTSLEGGEDTCIFKCIHPMVIKDIYTVRKAFKLIMLDPCWIHYVGFHKLFKCLSGQIENLRMSELQCSLDISEPKYTRNSCQPNTCNSRQLNLYAIYREFGIKLS